MFSHLGSRKLIISKPRLSENALYVKSELS